MKRGDFVLSGKYQDNLAYDLSMFEAVGTRFAVGNAIDALKRQADHVLPDRDHDPITAAAAILGI